MATLSQDDGMKAAQRLLEKTRTDDQNWEVYAGGAGEYRTSAGRFTFYVSSRDDDDEAPFDFEVWRIAEGPHAGVKVLQVSTAIDDRERNELLKELYLAAKSSALGLRDVREDLFEDLS